MSQKDEISNMTAAIITAHKGRSYFNYGEASDIVGCGRHTFADLLNRAGITVQKLGPSKRVSAYDIALAMAQGKISPVDNTTSTASNMEALHDPT